MAYFLARAGSPVSIDTEHNIAHNKVMIVDYDSFNLTKSAKEGYAENCL